MSDDENENEVFKYQYKVLVLGDGSVGKTSIIHRSASDDFKNQYRQTIGVDWFKKVINIGKKHEITLQIWDIGGQQISSKYIFGSHCVILVYDITQYDSYKNLIDWYKLVRKVYPKTRPHVVLMANKYDLEHLRMVREGVHEKFAIENNFMSFKVSAKSGYGINLAFLKIAGKLALIRIPKNEIENAQFLKANIINHPKTDTESKGTNNKSSKKKSTKKNCKVQ